MIKAAHCSALRALTDYDNDQTGKEAFITLFCVRREMQRMRLVSALMDACVTEAAAKGMKTIKLEVLRQDFVAIKFLKAQ